MPVSICFIGHWNMYRPRCSSQIAGTTTFTFPLWTLEMQDFRLTLHCPQLTTHTFLAVLAAPVCFCGQTLCISVTVLCFYVGSWIKPFSRWVFHVLLQKCEKTLPLHILLVCRAGTEEDLKSHTQSWESAPILLSGISGKTPERC